MAKYLFALPLRQNLFHKGVQALRVRVSVELGH
jgi:hypothetical protein